MTHTSSSPPSPSSRPETPDELQPAVPAEVRWALRLLWLSLGISAVQYLLVLPMVFGISTPTSGVERSAAIVGLVFGQLIPIVGYILAAYLNVSIARRKNWARVTKLILAVVGVAPLVVFWTKPTGLDFIGTIIVPALNFVALYMLFLTPGGRQWFRREDSHTEV